MRAIVETQLLGHAKSDRAIVSQIKLNERYERKSLGGTKSDRLP
nr:hypothetical protein [Hassalia byssoidea]